MLVEVQQDSGLERSGEPRHGRSRTGLRPFLSSFAISRSLAPLAEKVFVPPLLVVVPVGVVLLPPAIASLFSDTSPIGHQRSPPRTAATTYRQFRPSCSFACSGAIWRVSAKLISDASSIFSYRPGCSRLLGISLPGDQGASCGAQALLLDGLFSAASPRIPARAVDQRGPLLDGLDSADPQ
jgi:hypothetical protein